MKKPISKFLFFSIYILFLIVFLTACVNGQAGNYYVSQEGNDSNNGTTPANALATIQAAVNKAIPGDTILVLKGKYTEAVKISKSGTPESRIIIKAVPDKSVYLNGGFKINADFISIMGFNITNQLKNWPERIAIFIEGNNVEILNNYLYEVRNEAIRGSWKAMPRDILIENNKIYHSQMGIVVEGNSWIVKNNEVERLYNYGNGDCDYSRFFGDNHKFIANKYHGTLWAEIGKAHVDCFQTFDNNGQYAHNILIERNYCENFMQGFMGEAHFHHNISHILLRNNIFKDGFQMNSHGMIVQDISHVRIINNNFLNIKWRGVAIQPADNRLSKYAVIKNNIFYNCGTSYSFFDHTSSGDYNLIFMTPNNPNIGSHDIVNQDPNFNDIASGDFKLRIDSPAIDAGELTDLVHDDFYNTTRPVNIRHDIGAIEYNGSQNLPSDKQK